MSDSLRVLEGPTSIQSSFGPKATMDRLDAEIHAKGLNVFARIDHAAGPAEVGLTFAVLKTNPDGAGIVQAIGPLKVLASNEPKLSAPQRFLIVTDIQGFVVGGAAAKSFEQPCSRWPIMSATEN